MQIAFRRLASPRRLLFVAPPGITAIAIVQSAQFLRGA